MLFGVSFWDRKRTYEVFLQKEGRWQLHVLCDDEKDAIDEARHLLMTGKTLGVKVVRHRTLSSLVSSETVVYEATANPPKDKPLTVLTPFGEVALCRTVDDLFTADGRRTIGQVLRDYLTRVNLSPTELLHSYSHLRKLGEVQGLVNAGLHRVAAAQAGTMGVPAKERLQVLDGLVTQAQQKARAFAAERAGYPDCKGGDLGPLSGFILDKVGMDHHDYVLAALISVWLFEQRSLLAKVEVLAAVAQQNLENGLVRQVDAILADMLSFATVVQELFAPNPNLGTALMQMGAVILCRKAAVERLTNPSLRMIAELIRQGHLPQSQGALAERLLREIGSDRPLDQRAPDQEGALLDQLVASLTGDDGTILGGDSTHKSVERRRLRQRQELLRAQGLHSVADNLR
ncbi:hypothetical protein [Niveispirillum fermenti]|uniref:hypothetical protein n=1 Tax=Niveispirillum fermenti TaxID=1233113 RepID=UPI003A8B2F52